jgi:hypothetical protein
MLIFSERSPAQSTLEKIGSIPLQTIHGGVTTYFPDGYAPQAREVLELLEASIPFFENRFSVRQSFTIALLDSARWSMITHIPYGLPFVSGPPYVVCLPATSSHELARTIAGSIDGAGLDTKHLLENQEITRLFVSLIGLHELGHIFTWTTGLATPNKWIEEFAATYIAWDYLIQNFPEKAALWVDAAQALAGSIRPAHTSLTDFETLYFRTGIANYAWYQSVFLLGVKDVYELQGKYFLDRLRSQNWSDSQGPLHQAEMEAIYPGFAEWAAYWRLVK